MKRKKIVKIVRRGRKIRTTRVKECTPSSCYEQEYKVYDCHHERHSYLFTRKNICTYIFPQI